MIDNPENNPHILVLKKDRKLFKAIKAMPTHTLLQRKNIYLSLVSSIISQQLSTRVAEVIYGRFLRLFGKKIPTTEMILALDFALLRSVGLSNAKANYVRNVCLFFKEHSLTDAKLKKMTDEAIIDLLTQIKGVGRWTVEMILMFTLGREDVFAADDLVIQQGMVSIYTLEAPNKKQLVVQMKNIAECWRPYRTYACRYIWNWKDL